MITVEERKRFLGTNEALRRVSVGVGNTMERKERGKKKGGKGKKSLWDARSTQTVNRQTIESHGKTIHFWLNGLDSSIYVTKTDGKRKEILYIPE